MGDLHYIDDNSVEKIVVNQSDVDDTPVDGVLIAPISSNWAYDHENDPDVHDATQVNVAELPTATYDDVQDYINFFGDRTLITGGALTDNGDGTVAVAEGRAWAKVSDSDTAVGVFFDFPADASVSLTDLTTNFLYVDYNGGTPQIVVSTSILTHGFKQDHIHIATAFREGTVSHFHETSTIGIGRMNRTDIHHREEVAVHRVDGIVTSSIGTRNLSITAGVLYEGLSRHTTSPFDTPNSGTADATEANKLHDADGGFAVTDVGKTVHNTTDDTYAEVTAFVDSGELTLSADIFVSGENYDLDLFTYWYTTDSGSTWAEVLGTTALSNSQYNNIASGLVNLTTNRYGVHWVYMEVDGEHFHVVYGQGNYKANEAEEASPPSITPNIVTQYCALIAKIIIQQGTDTLLIVYPWTDVLTSSLATDHGSLGGLEDVVDHAYALLHNGTRALSGAWDMGSQNLTNVDIDSGTIDGVTITDPTINGTIATTGLTMPAFTLGANVNVNNRTLTNVRVINASSADQYLQLKSERTAANAGIAVYITTYDVNDTMSNRLTLTGGVDTAVATWANVTHTGIVLSGTMDANSQALINVVNLDLGTASATGTFDATLTAANAGTAWLIRSRDSGDTHRARLGLSGGVDTAVWGWVNSTHTGIVLSGALDANSNLINNVTDPSDPQDAATKQYVDDSVGGAGITSEEALMYALNS